MTPAVLPPNSRTFVVIDVPPGTGWGLFVNAGRAGGGFAFTASDVDGCGGDVPIEVFIDRAGEPSWQAPLGQWCGPG
ncbi:MAG: hypothetical protein ABI725_08665 [Chloroflexota bacterium]